MWGSSQAGGSSSFCQMSPISISLCWKQELLSKLMMHISSAIKEASFSSTESLRWWESNSVSRPVSQVLPRLCRAPLVLHSHTVSFLVCSFLISAIQTQMWQPYIDCWPALTLHTVYICIYVYICMHTIDRSHKYVQTELLMVLLL